MLSAHFLHARHVQKSYRLKQLNAASRDGTSRDSIWYSELRTKRRQVFLKELIWKPLGSPGSLPFANAFLVLVAVVSTQILAGNY